MVACQLGAQHEKGAAKLHHPAVAELALSWYWLSLSWHWLSWHWLSLIWHSLSWQ
jgi:hypothetical protein